MEIFTLLETLEEILEQSKKLPFTDKAVVDKEAILEVIKEIRLKLPDELKQAKWIKEERQRILTEAQKEANDIVKEAETRIISMMRMLPETLHAGHVFRPAAEKVCMIQSMIRQIL